MTQKYKKMLPKSILLTVVLIAICSTSLLKADLTDSDWNTVNDLLRNKRNAAGTNAALNTQCSAAAVCLEVSKWLYEMAEEGTYRQNLINEANDILNISNFSYAPWAVYNSNYGITILATEDMAYLFRHNGTDYVFLDSIYYYDPSLGGSSSDHTERQRLFVRPSTNLSRPLWSVECSESNHSNEVTLTSDDAYSMNSPVIGGTNGIDAWVEFKWDYLQIPSTDRQIRVKVRVEVFTGTQNITDLSLADSTHSSWRINAKHESGDDVNIWQVEFPIIERLEKFHRFPSDQAYICLPKQAGAKIPLGQTDDSKFDFLEYPGAAHFQFALSYQKNAGMIYYCDDIEGYRKAMKALDNSTGTDLTWIHYPKMQGHSTAQVKMMNEGDLGYACRIGAFKGDWYDAAVWYRENWLDESYADLLPTSLKGGWLLNAHHGTYTWEKLNNAYNDWLDDELDDHFPGITWPGSHSAYKWRNDFQPQSIQYNGQWVYEPWIWQVTQTGRDYTYDPIPSNHYSAVAKLTTRHNIGTIFYTPARLICRLFNNYGEYPDSPHYVYDGDIWRVLTSNGTHQPYIPEYDNQNNLIGNRGFVCPACSEWRDLLAEQVEQMVIRANYGTASYPAAIYMDVACTRPGYGGPCYNTHPDHGHPDQRGGGNHYAVGTNAMLDAVSIAGKYGTNNPDFMVISEGIADIFIKHTDSYIYFSINNDTIEHVPIDLVLWGHRIRPFGSKFAGVPWGGDSSRVKTARAFVAGVPLARIRENTFTAADQSQIRAIKRMVWYRRYFDEFIATGQMIRPPATDKAHNEVLCTAWKSGNKVFYAFANGTDSTLTVNADMEINSAGIINPLAYRLYEVNQDGSYEPEPSGSTFLADGTVQETFTLQPLGSSSGNQGVLCFIAESPCNQLDTDLEPDGSIDFKDFACLAEKWLDNNCGFNNNCCQGADLTNDGEVNIYDLDLLIEDWLF